MLHRPCLRPSTRRTSRAVSGKKVEKAGMSVSTDPSKTAHLCKDHYREFKKKTKKDRMLDRLDW
jgi:hypothetical protein